MHKYCKKYFKKHFFLQRAYYDSVNKNNNDEQKCMCIVMRFSSFAIQRMGRYNEFAMHCKKNQIILLTCDKKQSKYPYL